MTTGTNVAETILVAGILIFGIALLTGMEARAEEKCRKEATCLLWKAPNTYVNGAYLPEEDLASFNIYIYKGERKPDCETITNTEDEKVIVKIAEKPTPFDANRVEYNVKDHLSPGKYYFTVTAVTNNNLESTCSNIEGKEV